MNKMDKGKVGRKDGSIERRRNKWNDCNDGWKDGQMEGLIDGCREKRKNGHWT